MVKLCVVALSAFSMLVWQAPAGAEPVEPKAGTAEQPTLPGTEEAPGYEDFEKSDPSPEEVREEQEREDDRNIISPSMQDGEPLPGMDAD
ncbi:MAG: hypothetical protein K2Q28_01350 [Hyphomicrobium sp.]|nr:hypothetical protein [Hyphomicrobium sp.]